MINFEFHPAANLFPLMQEEELQGLSKDIQANGQRDPIVILEGKILDGRNRWKACRLAEVEPKIRLVTLLEIGGSPTQYVLSTNLHRRHLSAIQKASVAADALPLFEEEARARQVTGKSADGEAGGRGNKKEDKPSVQNAPKVSDRPPQAPRKEDEGRARAQAAQATGAGQRATTSMIAVKKAAPDVFQAVKDGKIDKVTEAERISKFSPEKREAVLTRIDAGEKPTEAIRKVKQENETKREPMKTSKHDIHYSSKSAEHYTPRHVLDLVVECLGSIDLDPCSNSKKDPNVPAARCYTKEDDGLILPWASRVFLNPPYGSAVGEWIDKLNWEHGLGRVSESITLVAARVDTAWWRKLTCSSPAWCAVKGRLTFGGNTDPAQFPSALVYIGSEPGRFASIFRGLGTIWAPYGFAVAMS